MLIPYMAVVDAVAVTSAEVGLKLLVEVSVVSVNDLSPAELVREPAESEEADAIVTVYDPTVYVPTPAPVSGILSVKTAYGFPKKDDIYKNPFFHVMLP